MLPSLRSRLLGSYILIIVISLAVTGITLTFLLTPQVTRLTYLRLIDRSLPTALHVRSLRTQGHSADQIIETLKEQAANQGTRILIVTEDGTVLADTEDRWVGRGIDLARQASGREGRRLQIQGRLTTGEGLFFYVAVPTEVLSRPRGESQALAWYVVLLSPPRQVLATFVGEMSVGFIPTGIVSLLVSIGVAILITRSIAKPLQQIATATEKIARGDYDQQLNIASPDEVRCLADSFNAMVREVKASRQAQQDFVANVSHDLKTPLTSIRGFSQALLNGTAAHEESGRRAAQIIHEEASRMVRLVDDLLDLARIEAGQIVMAQEPVPLPQLLQECADKMALRAEQSEVTIALELETDSNLIVKGDRDRLAQVIGNLLDNALKHTPPAGRISLAARSVVEEGTKRAEESGSHVEITISDTGAGIPPEDLSRIFERFYRGDKSRTKDGKGAGLGLAIAKEIIQTHGGHIKAESVVGLGTKFTITLPQSGDAA
ncbi:MAG: HAMP domain-containing protein [Anaerolineae bacterium]|nr:HAMP domain-containing protein [Anaerolineae bacterium]NIN99043.1 HAMP domain-containing protein [Anaerolineae bacterium]NIQ81891.1 HAMP domain-containing protein [Anaerolineae bacterium]